MLTEPGRHQVSDWLDELAPSPNPATLTAHACSPPTTSYCTANKNTALHLAARGGNTPCVAVLLQQRAPVNQVNLVGDTPLMLAAARGHGDSVRLLIGQGAKVEARDRYGSTSLLLACLGVRSSTHRIRVTVCM